MKAGPLLAFLLVTLLSGCAALKVQGPSALAHSTCAAPNDAVPPNGAYVVCMSGPRSR